MTTNQQRALTALLTCRTRRDAARAAGLDPRTVRRYFEDAEFVAAYKRELSGLIDDAAAQAKRALSPALGVLQEITEDAAQPASARISAARCILEYGLRLTEIADILQELEGEG